MTVIDMNVHLFFGVFCLLRMFDCSVPPFFVPHETGVFAPERVAGHAATKAYSNEIVHGI